MFTGFTHDSRLGMLEAETGPSIPTGGITL